MNQNSLAKTTITTGAGSACTQMAQPGQLQSQIDLLHSAAVQANNLCDELNSRLKGVLRDRQEEKDTGEKPEEMLVQYANQIRGEHWNVETLCRKLQSILDRLEA